MTSHTFARADWNITEQFEDRFSFSGVIERRRSAVSVDVVHLIGPASRTL